MGESETRVSADMRREEEGFKVWRPRYLAETTHSQEEAFHGFRGTAGYPGGEGKVLASCFGRTRGGAASHTDRSEESRELNCGQSLAETLKGLPLAPCLNQPGSTP